MQWHERPQSHFFSTTTTTFCLLTLCYFIAKEESKVCFIQFTTTPQFDHQFSCQPALCVNQIMGSQKKSEITPINWWVFYWAPISVHKISHLKALRGVSSFYLIIPSNSFCNNLKHLSLVDVRFVAQPVFFFVFRNQSLRYVTGKKT